MGALASVLHRLADAVSPPPEDVPIRRPPGLHWSNREEARAARNQMALALLEDETIGAVTVMVRTQGEHGAHVVISGEVRDELWPSISRALSLIEHEARHV